MRVRKPEDFPEILLRCTGSVFGAVRLPIPSAFCNGLIIRADGCGTGRIRSFWESDVRSPRSALNSRSSRLFPIAAAIIFQPAELRILAILRRTIPDLRDTILTKAGIRVTV